MRLWLLALAGCAWVEQDAHVEELRRVWSLEVSAEPLEPCAGVAIVASTAFEVPSGTTASWVLHGAGGVRLRDGSIEVAQVAEGERWVARVQTSALPAAVFEGFDEACAGDCELALTVPLDDVDLVATAALQRVPVPGLPGVSLTSGASLTGVLYVEDEPELSAAEPTQGWTVTAEACPDAGPCLESAFNAGLARTLPLAACGDRVGETGWTLSLRLDRDDCDATFARSAPIPVRFAASDCDGDGHLLPEDCDDLDPGVSWFALYDDDDGDGFGAGDPFPGCEGEGVLVGGDCDDADGDRNPGMTDTPCDGIDQDCDGDDAAPPAPQPIWVDGDGDGYGDSALDPVTEARCAEPGEALVGGDCDDVDSTVSPGLPEDWSNRIDNNCDGVSVFPVYIDDPDAIQLLFAQEGALVAEQLGVTPLPPAQTLGDLTPPFVVGEVDCDAFPDVIDHVAGEFRLRRGIAGGTGALPTPVLGAPSFFTLGADPIAFALGDVNGDGIQDLVTLATEADAFDASVSVPVVNVRPGPIGVSLDPLKAYVARASSIVIPPPAYPYERLTLGDVDGDGIDDIVVWGGGVGVRVVRGTSETELPDAEQWSSALPTRLVVADLTPEGGREIVLRADGKASVLGVDQEGPWEVPLEDSPGSLIATWEGVRSFIALGDELSPNGVANVVVLELDPARVPVEVDQFDVTGGLSALAFGDFDGDGSPDLFAGTGSATAGVDLNRLFFGVGSFLPVNGALAEPLRVRDALAVRHPSGRDDLVLVLFDYDHGYPQGPPPTTGWIYEGLGPPSGGAVTFTGQRWVTHQHRQPPVALGTPEARDRMFPVCLP